MATLNEYLTKLASEEPAPGGGSAAMVVGATGCSLVAMVARICAGSKKYEPVHPLAHRLIKQADELRERMLELRERDEAAYAAVVAARGDKEAMQRALFDAAAAPLAGAKAAVAGLRLSSDALELKNGHLISDVGCAAEFSYAALIGCAHNVRINHKFMKDQSAIEAHRAELEHLESDAQTLLAHVRRAVNQSLRPDNA